MKTAFSLLFFCLLGLQLAAQPEIEVDPRLGEALKSHGYPKGVVLLGLEVEQFLTFTTNDPLAANFGTLPASTFKIPNSLIGLETGTVTLDYKFKWDGKPRRLKSWEQDFDLAGAFKASCLPCYQELALKVGKERMEDWLLQLGYGNMEMGGGLDKFWITGKLRISPLEQIYFLHRLANEQLPFTRANQAAVRDMMLLDTRDGHRLYGKTGWADEKENIGWFVGWVEGNGPRVFFATRILATNPPDTFGPARRQITETALQAMGYWQ
jgi:beta-lactamase class D